MNKQIKRPMKMLILHIGFYKTGTTFLQHQIFPKLKGINYIDLRDNELKRLFLKLCRENLAESDKETLQKKVNSVAGKTHLQTSLISFESLSGDPFNPKSKSHADILKEIKEIFREFKIRIILGIRRQEELIISLYKQYLHQGGTGRLNEFIEECNGGEWNPDGSLFRNYFYSNYVKEIERRFGKKNLYVYLYEDMRNKNSFLRKLMDFLGEKNIPRYRDAIFNKGYGASQARIAMRLNWLFRSRLNPKGIIPSFNVPGIGVFSPRLLLQNRLASKLFRKEYEPEKWIVDKISGIYEKENEKLCRIGIHIPR